MHAFLECLLPARFALPSRLRRDVIFTGLRSEGSARARRELTHRTHIWLLLGLHRNSATRGTCREITIVASPSVIISRSLFGRTEGVRRFLHTAQIAFHWLRIAVHVCVAAPTLG